MANLPRRAARLAVIVVAVTAAAVCADPAVAATVRLDLRFTCSSAYGDAAMTGQVGASVPDSAVVGKAVPGIALNASGTVGSIASFGLGLIGATSVEGTADAVITVQAPQGDSPVSVRLTIPNTRVPASGPVTVGASGIMPVFVFNRPGSATLSFNSLTLHLTPVTSSGTTPVGTVDASCVLAPGQNGVLYKLPVTPAAVNKTPTPAHHVPAPFANAAATPGTSTTATAAVAPASSSSAAAASAPAAHAPPADPRGVSVARRSLASASGGSGPVVVAALGVLAVCGLTVGSFIWRRRRRGPEGGGNG